MEIKDCKVGQKIIANESSNERYITTNKSNGFIGEITEVDTNFIRAKTLQNSTNDNIGKSYVLLPKYFDLYEDITEIKECKGMKIERVNRGIELKNANYGDVMELVNGDMVMIVPDIDNEDYRGFNLSTFEYTRLYFDVDDMFNTDDYEVKNLIPKEHVTLKIEG